MDPITPSRLCRPRYAESGPRPVTYHVSVMLAHPLAFSHFHYQEVPRRFLDHWLQSRGVTTIEPNKVPCSIPKADRMREPKPYGNPLSPKRVSHPYLKISTVYIHASKRGKENENISTHHSRRHYRPLLSLVRLAALFTEFRGVVRAVSSLAE